MKITRTAPDVFNIWLRRAKGCELTYAELTAILTSMECSVNSDYEGLPLDFMLEVNDKLYSAREKMLKHERLKKRFEINQKIIRFCLDFPLKMRIFALLSEGSPVWHEHCSNTTQTLHRHDTNISALLQYFCIDFAAFALRLNPNESTNSHKFSQKYFLLLTLEISFCLTY